MARDRQVDRLHLFGRAASAATYSVMLTPSLSSTITTSPRASKWLLARIEQNRRRYCATSDEARMAAETVVKPRDEGFELGEHEVL